MPNETNPRIAEGPPSGEQPVYSTVGSRESERATPRGDTHVDRSEASATDHAREGMEDGTQRVREDASEITDRTREQAESAREGSAEGMGRAADEMRSRFGGQDNVTGKAADATADSLDRTAGYLKSHDNREIMNDLECYVREHPYQAMAGALAAGFIISRVLR